MNVSSTAKRLALLFVAGCVLGSRECAADNPPTLEGPAVAPSAGGGESAQATAEPAAPAAEPAERAPGAETPRARAEETGGRGPDLTEPAAAPRQEGPERRSPSTDAAAPRHEVFLSPAERRADQHVDRGPPEPINERPGDRSPTPNSQWIEGYWDYDSAANDYVWITGAWRAPEPGTFWVNGYWRRDDKGWFRVPGFWSRRQTTRADWRKVGPPADRPDDRPGAPPGPDYFFVPGQYVPDGNGVVWKPGFWSAAQPGWEWVPDNWMRRSSGWEYLAGFWKPARTSSGDRPFSPAGNVARTAPVITSSPAGAMAADRARAVPAFPLVPTGDGAQGVRSAGMVSPTSRPDLTTAEPLPDAPLRRPGLADAPDASRSGPLSSGATDPYLDRSGLATVPGPGGQRPAAGAYTRGYNFSDPLLGTDRDQGPPYPGPRPDLLGPGGLPLGPGSAMTGVSPVPGNRARVGAYIVVPPSPYGPPRTPYPPRPTPPPRRGVLNGLLNRGRR